MENLCGRFPSPCSCDKNLLQSEWNAGFLRVVRAKCIAQLLCERNVSLRPYRYSPIAVMFRWCWKRRNPRDKRCALNLCAIIKISSTVSSSSPRRLSFWPVHLPAPTSLWCYYCDPHSAVNPQQGPLRNLGPWKSRGRESRAIRSSQS